MSQKHDGNIQPGLDYEEHDGLLNAKRVSVASIPTIYAVVNTGAAGISNSIVTVANNINLNSNITLNASPNYVGLMTVDQGSGPWRSMATLFPGPNYIGLVTTTFGSLTTLASGPNYVGLATVDFGSQNIVRLNSVVTLSPSVANIGFATVQPAAAWPDPKTYIGLVTTSNALSWPDPKTYIGLTTATIGNNLNLNSNVTLNAGLNNIGFATIAQAFPGGATIYTFVLSAVSMTTIFVAPANNSFYLRNLHISSLGRTEVEFRSNATALIPFTSLSTTSGFAAFYGEKGLQSRAQADALVVNINVGGSTISGMAEVRFAP